MLTGEYAKLALNENKRRKMKESIRYEKVKPYVSGPRIGTYENFFQEHSVEEIYGVYLWNKVLCGSIYPLLQATEVALRNAINAPAEKEFGSYWYEAIEHNLRNKRRNTQDYNHTNLINKFELARKNVVKKLNESRKKANLTALPSTHQPDFNLVVAATDFSTWEFALHTCHYRVNNSNFLWPKLSKKAFKNWPTQSSSDFHKHIYPIVSELRQFRNRLSHHEPLWKGISVTTEEEALKFLSNKIDKIEELIRIISSEKTQLLNLQNLIVKARFTASKEMLDQCRYRSKGKQISIRKKKKLKQFLQELKQKKSPMLVNVAGQSYLVEAI
ncbi:Abi family protein [Photobacterium halotolerans]|uniref:Abi family protein n=1 Tax=Photobacterium halotolerans TaxID=265726 RepID=UPI001B7FED66|nr:Abi family protein [Photobacterium halotolerans]